MSLYMVRGVVVNPKYNKPCLVVSDSDGSYIDIYRMDKPGIPHEGKGYYDKDYGDEYGIPATVTGLPRSHTPDGVESFGEGYGTCLYTAMCLAAYQAYNNEGPIEASAEGEGISSMTGTRSGEADEWWDKALGYDMTTRDDYDHEIEGYEADHEVSTADLENIGIGHNPERTTVSHINCLSVDIDVTYEVDVYRADTAEEKGFFAANLVYDMEIDRYVGELGPHLELVNRDIENDDGGGVNSVDVDALIALDLRGITRASFDLIMLLARGAGVSGDDIEGMQNRWTMELDPEQPPKKRQQRLFPNAKAARVTQASMKEAAAMRRKLGWDKLKGLP